MTAAAIAVALFVVGCVGIVETLVVLTFRREGFSYMRAGARAEGEL
jgi:hypothetical protein